MALKTQLSTVAQSRPARGKIGVLMGGLSSERDISLKSGKAVLSALQENSIDAVGVDIISEDEKTVSQMLKTNQIECAFIALHGKFGEDGQVQRILELNNVMYTGSGVNASRLAMDKIASKRLFQAAGLEVPAYEIVEKQQRIISPAISVPLVVKPAKHGSSIGLSVVRNSNDLSAALEYAFSYDDQILIEEFIEGRELTVGVLNNRTLPVVEIKSKTGVFDFNAKYQQGASEYFCPAQLDQSVKDLVSAAALKAHEVLGCTGYSRVDIMISSNNIPYVLEVNTIPGMTQTSLLPKAAKAAGIDFSTLCATLLDLAYEKKNYQHSS